MVLAVVASGPLATSAGAQGASTAAKERWLALAEARERVAAEREQLAESIITEAESEGRSFEPVMRAYLKQELAKQPLEALREGDLSLLASTTTSRNLVYTPVDPCRVLDTRSSAGGILAPGTAQAFLVAGTADLSAQGGSATGCGVPLGATAVAVNFGATQSAGPGNVRAYAWSAMPTVPGAATLNFGNLAAVGLVTVPNGAIVPLCDPAVETCTSDLYLQSFANSTHVVADVTGYFTRASVIDQATQNGNVVEVVAGTCTNYDDGAPWGVTITVPVAGRITVTGIVQFYVIHTFGQPGFEVDAIIGTSPTDCSANYGYDNFAYVDDNEPTTSSAYFPIVPVQKVFDVSPGTYTYYLNGQRFSGGTDTAYWWWASLTASFQPN
jgi:hypothetical protein